MGTDFDETGFWDKVQNVALTAGREVIEKSLWLYYAAQGPDTPAWAKSVIYAAIAYFVLPIDAIPDLIPITGFTDDLGALAAAVTAVALFIDEDVKRQAETKLALWFGETNDSSEKSI